MQEFLRLVIGGAVAGGIYATLACGVVLTYQTSGVFNFAHGAVAFATAFLFVQLHEGAGLPIVPAAVLAILVFAPLVGVLLDRILFRHLTSAPVAVRVVVTIGLLVAVPGACLFIVDRLNAWFKMDLPVLASLFQIPGLGPSPRITWNINGVLIDSNEIAVFWFAAVVAAGLWALVRHTRFGLEMRAVVDRRDLARLRGIDADRTSTLAWALASGLAGVAGILLASQFNTLDPTAFTTLVLISTPAVVIARFHSLPLAFAGGLAVGVVQNLVTGYATFARHIVGFTTAVPYIVLLIALIAFASRRRGRNGRSDEIEIGAVDGPPTGKTVLMWLAGAGVLLVCSQVIANDYWNGLLARGLALALVLLSFTVVTGMGGMVSLAQAAFVTAAGFTAGWALSHGWPFGIALLVGSAVAAALGVVVSLSTRRLGGLPLALATLALAFIAQDLFFQLNAVSNFAGGGWVVRPPVIGPLDLRSRTTMVTALLVLVGLASWLVHNLLRSSSGRAMAALRSSERGAVTVGVASARTRLALFTLSAGIAGFGGVMMATVAGRVTRADFPVYLGLFWLASVVAFGVRRPGGAVLAGLAAALSPQLFSYLTSVAYLPQVTFGLAAVGLAHQPDGLLALVSERRQSRRRALSSGPEIPAAPSSAATAGPEAPVVAPADARLVLRGITAAYYGIDVLHGIDLAVRPGEVTAVVGPNGAGKSTLCSLVAGLLLARRGDIHLDGEPITGRASHWRTAAGVFLVPEGRGIFQTLTVEENLAVWLRSAEERIHAYERFPVLGDRRWQLAGTLSGGEQQMLALAPALVRPPRLLVVDEPSLGLAPIVVERVYSALRELRDRGTSILLVEEKAHDVLQLADTVAFMNAGRVIWHTEASEVDETRLVESYLGIDGTSQ